MGGAFDFSIEEFIQSDTAERMGIGNLPPPDIEATLRNVLMPAMQLVRDTLGAPVIVRSGYRSPELNAAVRGASSSQHLTGHACDFIAPRFGTPLQVARHLAERIALIRFDQLIQEGNWVHISFSPRPRSEVLTAHFAGGRVSYTRGLA